MVVKSWSMPWLCCAWAPLPSTHTHTHTHKHTHTRKHAHTNTCTLTNTCTHTNTRTHTHKHMHSHTHTNTRTLMHTNTRTHTHTHTNTRTQSQSALEIMDSHQHLFNKFFSISYLLLWKKVNKRAICLGRYLGDTVLFQKGLAREAKFKDKVKVKVTKSYPTLCEPMDYILPGIL